SGRRRSAGVVWSCVPCRRRLGDSPAPGGGFASLARLSLFSRLFLSFREAFCQDRGVPHRASSLAFRLLGALFRLLEVELRLMVSLSELLQCLSRRRRAHPRLFGARYRQLRFLLQLAEIHLLTFVEAITSVTRSVAPYRG